MTLRVRYTLLTTVTAGYKFSTMKVCSSPILQITSHKTDKTVWYSSTRELSLHYNASTHTVQHYSVEGKLLKKVGGKGNDKTKFRSPYGVTVSADNIVYVCDYGNNRVQGFTTRLKYSSTIGNGQLDGPLDVKTNEKGGDEHTFIVENLYPAVTVVSNVYRTRRVINCDSTWVVEFSTFATFTAGGHTWFWLSSNRWNANCGRYTITWCVEIVE